MTPNSKSQKYRPKFIIVFKRSDLPLANYLCQLTGCGKVYDKPERGYVLWQIQKVLDVFKITSLINGYMRTPKQEALCRVIDWINDYIKNNKESNLPATQKILSGISPLKKEAVDISAIDSNPWLTGFIDSDGHFSISLSKRSRKHLDKVIPHFRLEIRQTYHITPLPGGVRLPFYPQGTANRMEGRTSGNEIQACTNKSSLLDNSNSSYYLIMSAIATFLDVNLNSRIRCINNKKYSSFIVAAANKKSLDILIKYLTKYPLLSSKYLDFRDWSEVIDFIKKNGNNNVPGGSWELASIKRKDYNKTRITFTWKHLDSTYIG